MVSILPAGPWPCYSAWNALFPDNGMAFSLNPFKFLLPCHFVIEVLSDHSISGSTPVLSVPVVFLYIKYTLGASLMVQWLRLHTSTAGGQVWSLVRELRFGMPHSTAKTLKNKIKSIKNEKSMHLTTVWTYAADCLSLPQSNVNSMRAGSAPVFCSLLGPKTYNGV